MTDTFPGRATNLTETVDRLLRIGPVAAMREDEEAAGFTLLTPGDRPWFLRVDWPDNAIVSTDGKSVRIVAIIAQRPGTGAFRRMVDGIRADGLTPIVVEPIGTTMPAILKRWGWKRKRVGRGFQAHDTWQPA